MSYPTYPNTYKKVITVGDKTITLEVGKFSEQASAAILATCGETVVHTTIALGRKVNLGYFPLSVEFAEKLYSSGIIKGSRWVKRDGRPTDDVILKARVIDRSLRPMFPDGITNEVQVINTVFSYDGENDPDMLGLLSSAAGLAISEIPFDGPLAGLRVGYSKETEKFSVNPTETERTSEDLDLIVSGSGDSIVMVEAGANEVPEAAMVEALVLAQKTLGEVCAQIGEMVADIGKEKIELVAEEDKAKTEATKALAAKIDTKFVKEVRAVVEKQGRLEPTDTASLVEEITAWLNEGKAAGEAGAEAEDMIEVKAVEAALSVLKKQHARDMIIKDKKRPDGRQPEEVRQIWCEVDVFPRTHGSAMFKRGATQAVTITTLGNPSLGQLIEGIEGEEVRHYMHHYNMPPYASGEAGRFGFPKRREIGHGALAERALAPMIPSQAEFPYAILVVSEIVSSNGSTSQASVCGSTLSLMAAGVPIKRPVAGIAMGMISDGKDYTILSDIQGLEDHVGDMDFKVAGSSEGITAIQMDIKLKGLDRSILEKALEQSRVGRLHILSEMLKTLDTPRTVISQYAPKILQIRIPAERIGELIGPGGKMIKSIIQTTGTDINVDEDEENKEGLVNISSPDQDKIDHAARIINNMMRVVDVGEEFEGDVTRVESYGAFVEYLPGREGLVHVSAMSADYVQDAADLVKVGDTVKVWINEVKEDGKIGLAMLSPEQMAEAKANRPQGGGGRDGGGRGFGGGGRDGGRSFGGGRGGDRGGRGGYGGGRPSGGDRGGRDGGGRPPFRGGRDSR
jgi:polyribonucleotide nucleotidyltransferase